MWECQPEATHFCRSELVLECSLGVLYFSPQIHLQPIGSKSLLIYLILEKEDIVIMGRSWSSSIFRWPDFDFSGLYPNWALLFRWSDMEVWIVDSVLWTVVMVLESLALVAMLCFFFIFCGCSI
ncbi:hypothetical protein CKAN_02457900 [Cinnamomum micranthum f. kanehirae]|uniref:Uncharacterized protein n=1 Tax=Cinnamomum micranthum f. kanehirae TaxID=337451 RepID=A0A3S3N3I3_9MAGN|nr:hypothetical protein CKAN_02457900 [Cinnamomum micranthum f. kanehirae]